MPPASSAAEALPEAGDGGAPRAAAAATEVLCELVSRARRLAADALRDGRPQECMKLCNEALEGALSASPGDADAVSEILAERAEARLALGDCEAALDDARTAVATHVSAKARAGRAAQMGAPRDRAHALSKLFARLTHARDFHTLLSQALLLLGRALHAVHDYADAQRIFAAGLQLNADRCVANQASHDRSLMLAPRSSCSAPDCARCAGAARACNARHRTWRSWQLVSCSL
jgi:hypothetical protein